MPGTIDLVRANFKARRDIMAELRSIEEAATTDNRAFTEDELALVAEKRSQLDSIDDRIEGGLKIETRSQEIEDGMERFLGVLADRERGETYDTRSLGQRFIDNDDFRSWAAGGGRGQYGMEFDGVDFRAVTDTTLGTYPGNTSGGAFTRPDRLARVGQDFIDRRVFLIDYLPHITTGTLAVEYVQDKSPLADVANKAAETTEESTKPQAGVTLAVVQEAVATIAVWSNLTRQVAADVPQIQSYLDGRLRYSLKRRTDGQVINGDGNAPNIKGLVNRSGILTNAPGSAEARYKTIRHSIKLMEDVEQVPEIIVVNPADAELFDLSNAASAGLHAVMDNDSTGQGALTGGQATTMWGLRRIVSTAVTSGTALLLDPMSLAVIDRQQPTAYITDSHASNFTANILTLLLELRAGLALFNPTGVLLATFNGTT